jgi:hypothetical protein
MSDFAALPKKKPLLSMILHKEGVLTDAQLDKALRTWEARRLSGRLMAFGQVVIQLGFLRGSELAPFLKLQRALAAPPSERKVLGILILENGLLRPGQLLSALQRQSQTGRRLGEELIDMGLLRQNQLEILLRFQGRNLAA